MSRYFYSLLLLLLPLAAWAQNQNADSVAVAAKAPVKKQFQSGRQLCLGFDIARIAFNQAYNNRKSYELRLDYYLKNELYVVAEGGWGNAALEYDNLRYKTNNVFFRAGIDKAMFPRKKAQDWSGAFIGLRYGVGLISRSDAWYQTNDGWGNITSGTTPGADVTAHWFELTAGMRVELWSGVFAGWNARGRFLLNSKALGELKPEFIAGYGRGDKSSSFDFNAYLSYALRWGAPARKPVKP